MEYLEITIRIVMAIIIGGFIGYEREMRNRPAGFVTHTLVCVGACVVSLIQIHMVQDTIAQIEANPLLAAALKADIGRIVAQVVTGVGFLGAGTIVFDKGSVKGLTTATTIWVVACIGLGIGLGYYKMSIIAAVGVIFVIVVLKRIESNTLDRKYSYSIEIKYDSREQNFIREITGFLRKHKVQIRDIEILESKDEEIKVCRFVLYLGFGRNLNKIITKLSEKDEVLAIARK